MLKHTSIFFYQTNLNDFLMYSSQLLMINYNCRYICGYSLNVLLFVFLFFMLVFMTLDLCFAMLQFALRVLCRENSESDDLFILFNRFHRIQYMSVKTFWI